MQWTTFAGWWFELDGSSLRGMATLDTGFARWKKPHSVQCAEWDLMVAILWFDLMRRWWILSKQRDQHLVRYRDVLFPPVNWQTYPLFSPDDMGLAGGWGGWYKGARAGNVWRFPYLIYPRGEATQMVGFHIVHPTFWCDPVDSVGRQLWLRNVKEGSISNLCNPWKGVIAATRCHYKVCWTPLRQDRSAPSM